MLQMDNLCVELSAQRLNGMSTCEVEPLDLSMDSMHDVYEQHFEKVTASEDMKRKMEELAKEMSHFSYKDLWTECCRRYKDIVKRLLGYEVHSHLLKSGVVPEPVDVGKVRKRKSSNDSSSSGQSDDSTLPLKKRYLRAQYKDNDVFDSRKSPSKLTDNTQQSIADKVTAHTVDCCKHESTKFTEQIPSGQRYDYCGAQTSQLNDLPCDLSKNNSTLSHAIPSLTKYDNSSLPLMGTDPNCGLLARLLTEPQSGAQFAPINSLSDRRFQKSDKISVMVGHGQNSFPVIVNHDIYSSPYLRTPGYPTSYPQPVLRQTVAQQHSGPTHQMDLRNVSDSNNSRFLKNCAVLGQVSTETTARYESTSKRRSKPLSLRENSKDKILKRLLQYSSSHSDEKARSGCDNIQTKDNQDQKNQSKGRSEQPKSFWDAIEMACVKIASV